MPSPTPARLVVLAAAIGALASLPACSRTVEASYPGGHVVEYPWRACGMYCDQAFSELETSHDPTGKGCEELVTKAASDAADGGDPRVSAAALYDSAIVLMLRGRQADAADRFARAEAFDPDPDYKDLARLSQESAQRYPVTPLPAPAPTPEPSATPGSETPAADTPAATPPAATAPTTAPPTTAPSAAPAPAPSPSSPAAGAPPPPPSAGPLSTPR